MALDQVPGGTRVVIDSDIEDQHGERGILRQARPALDAGDAACRDSPSPSGRPEAQQGIRLLARVLCTGLELSGPQAFYLARFLVAGPQIGSFTASPNPVTAGSNLTLTAGNISDANPGATITQVAFYYFDSSGTKQVLGYGTETSSGVWTLTFTVNLAPGTYTLYAQAEDSYGVFGDPCALTLTLN